MHPRDFLKLAGATLLGLTQSTLADNEDASSDSTKKQILIIGAGLAGLAAARELKSLGHDVIIVEARDRIGGRIWTSNRWSDLPADFGATWIHGVTDNPLTEIADRISARRLTTSYNRSVTYGTEGKPLTESEESIRNSLRKKIFRAVKAAQAAERDRSIREAVRPLIKEIDELQNAEEHHEHRTAKASRNLLNFILSGEIEQEYAGSAEKLSAHWYDSAEEFDGGDVLFADGFHVVTQHLAAELNIELQQVVKEIHWDESRVSVITQKRTFTADHVIVTLPLGVLQAGKVRFVPELLSEKLQAVSRIGMGILNKCYLRFEKAFWPDDVDWLEYVPAKHGEWTEWVSFLRTAGVPVLLGFNAADRGQEIEAWSDQQIVDSAMQTLKTIFGPRIPDPVDHQLTRWAADPYALGSYSYNPFGTSPGARKTLAAPLSQKVFFAGEATEARYFGTAHGACLSGIRAAREITSL